MLLLIKNPLNSGYLLAVYDTGINLLKTTINGLEILAKNEKSLKLNILAAREFGYI
jgi:hypothetical protein